MILTTPNLEKAVKAILGVFKRNKNNVRDYELKELESLLKHVESSFKYNANELSLSKKLVGLLMFHYTTALGGPKDAAFKLRNEIRLGNDLTIMKLKNAINASIREQINKELTDASDERKRHLIDMLLSEYTEDKIKESIDKTTHDLITINNNTKQEDEFF